MSEEKRNKFHDKWKEMPVALKVLIFIGIAALIAGLLVLFGFIVMWLWNALMPRLFGLPVIGYWEGWGIFILSHILFRGFHGSNHMAEGRRRHKLRERIKEVDDEGPEEPAGDKDR